MAPPGWTKIVVSNPSYSADAAAKNGWMCFSGQYDWENVTCYVPDGSKLPAGAAASPSGAPSAPAAAPPPGQSADVFGRALGVMTLLVGILAALGQVGLRLINRGKNSG